MDERPPGKSGFTWTLVGGLVLILALAAVGIPNYVRPPGRRISPKNFCITNLKQVDGAVQQWALEKSKAATDTYSLTDPAVLRFLRGSMLPECPLGGKYSAARNVDGAPTCTIPGHTL